MKKLKIGDKVGCESNPDYTYTIISIEGDMCTVQVNEEYDREGILRPAIYPETPLSILHKLDK